MKTIPSITTYRRTTIPRNRWVSIEKFTASPIPVDHLIKKGTIRTAESYEAWLDYSAKRSRSTFQGARIEVANLGNNRFKATTTHVDLFSLWLHPTMVDFDRPITVTTNGVTTEHTCKPSLLTALKSFGRKEDWGLIYPAVITVGIPR